MDVFKQTRTVRNQFVEQKKHTRLEDNVEGSWFVDICALFFYLTYTIVRRVKVDLMCHNFPFLFIGLTTDKQTHAHIEP